MHSQSDISPYLHLCFPSLDMNGLHLSPEVAKDWLIVGGSTVHAWLDSACHWLKTGYKQSILSAQVNHHREMCTRKDMQRM